MHKVTVERERYGSTRRNRKWGTRIAYVPNADYDDQPKFASSARGRQYADSQKRFSDVLGPLRGFLRSNIGRPWDNVFSELRQALDVRKVTGAPHLRAFGMDGRNRVFDRRGSEGIRVSAGI